MAEVKPPPVRTQSVPTRAPVEGVQKKVAKPVPTPTSSPPTTELKGPSITAEKAPPPVAERAERASLQRQSAALKSIEEKLTTVLGAHADTITVANADAPLSNAEAKSVREALFDAQQELVRALSGISLPEPAQAELTQLLANVRAASPHGDKPAAVAKTPLAQLQSLQENLTPFLNAASKLAEMPSKGGTALLLERACDSTKAIPPVIDRATAQALLSDVVSTRPTLQNMAARVGAFRVLAPILASGESISDTRLSEVVLPTADLLDMVEQYLTHMETAYR